MYLPTRAEAFAGLVVAALFAPFITTPACPQNAIASTVNASAMAPFDREIERFMAARHIPGGALAVVKEGRLVYARGYGWADRETHVPVSPDSLFRIASLSKPLTAVAVMKLIEDGRLHLDDKAFDIVHLQPVLEPGKQPDPRLKNVTVRQLLNHTAGWDSSKRFDPMFRSRLIARAVGVPLPASPEAIVRYMMGQPLDYDPGSHYVYSNFGYCVLGRVIEAVAGLRYEDYVKQSVLAPIGITDMRIGRSLKENRVKGEVCYYTTKERMTRTVLSESSVTVPQQYGRFCLEAMDAHGGWLASAVDLARFAAALDDPQHSPLLKPETMKIMYSRPAPPVGVNPDGSPADVYYACGWLVRSLGTDGKANYWHTGSLPGTWALLVRRWDRISWVVLFNQRSDDSTLPDAAIDPALHQAANAVTRWPAVDLFHTSRKGEYK